MRFGPILAAMSLALVLSPGLGLAETPRESLHWAGPYQGMLPCADCMGIVTLLELAPDGSYLLSESWAGRSDAPIVHRGSISWDDTGSVITLGGTDPARRYKLGQGRLWALDLSGQVIEGKLADYYILTKAE